MCTFAPKSRGLAESVDLLFDWEVYQVRRGGVRHGKQGAKFGGVRGFSRDSAGSRLDDFKSLPC